jgi:iron complex outermembrane receptor protein
MPVSCVSGATGCTSSTPQIVQSAPSGLWVQQTPTDTEAQGVTYQNKGWDLGLFNKRVGVQRIDNGAYHNQATIDPFTSTNVFLNYTIRRGGRFDQTKIRLSVNNLLDSHNVTGLTPNGSLLTQNIAANGTSYTDQFSTTGPTAVSGGDNVSPMAGRGITLSVTFGLNTRR